MEDDGTAVFAGAADGDSDEEALLDVQPLMCPWTET